MTDIEMNSTIGDQTNNKKLELQGEEESEIRQTNEHWNEKVRIGFIRKVYGILLVQLTFTFLLTLISVLSPSFSQFQLNSPGFFWLAIIGSIVFTILICCFRKLARTVPTNYLLLFGFTFCEAYLVSFVCGMTDPKLVLMAAAMTCAIVLSLTIYAWTTKTDFTIMGSMMFVISCVMLLFGIFMLFTQNKTLNIIYSCLGVLAFSIYLVYDTQLIVGNHQNKLEIDDYILGSIMLYLDIINLFLHILNLLKQLNR